MKTTLDELQAFTAVIDTGSISSAAVQLGQTASGISRALSRLEAKLATTLLRRTTRRLELTEEGAAFLSQARRILEAVEEAEEQMARRLQHPAGRLRVNASAPFMLHVLVPLIGGFRQRYPDIELELHSSDQIIDLLEHRTDLALRHGRCAIPPCMPGRWGAAGFVWWPARITWRDAGHRSAWKSWPATA